MQKGGEVGMKELLFQIKFYISGYLAQKHLEKSKKWTEIMEKLNKGR